MSGIEIIGGVAAILQLIACGERASSCFLDLVKKTHNPSKPLEELSYYIRSIIDRAKSIDTQSPETVPINEALQRCIEKSLALDEILRQLRFDIAKNGQRKSKGRIRIAAMWKWKEKEIEDVWNEVHRSIATLQFFISCGNRDILDRIEQGLRTLCVQNPFGPSVRFRSVSALRVISNNEC